ncbi:neutral/alkaline nonlysosomal ceramidase, partial [Tanacetum coccineum]
MGLSLPSGTRTEEVVSASSHLRQVISFPLMLMIILSGRGPVIFSNVNESVRMCPAAMGFAFAAGTTDGPGAFDFTQGDDQLVGGLLKKPDEKQIKGQDPKPILIDSGEMHEPYDWALYVRVNKKRMLLIGFAGSSFDLIRSRLLLLFRIDALLDFFHMVMFSLMVHHMEVLWVGLGFVFVKQEDEDEEDDDGGVILRLDEGMNDINVLDYVEVFGRDHSDTSVPFQHPLLMEPSSSRAISTRETDNTLILNKDKWVGSSLPSINQPGPYANSSSTIAAIVTSLGGQAIPTSHVVEYGVVCDPYGNVVDE